MKKQYIQPITFVSKMVTLASIINASDGINTTGSQFIGDNPDPDYYPIDTKERSGWGNLGDDQVNYGNIW